MYTLLPVGIGLCLLAAMGAGLGMGLATGKAVDATSRQPEAAGKIRTMLLLGLAITESCAIYGFVTALIMLFSMK
jgi:F-type H+-transporting ATPase subunit c